ncbi:hypothetical protein JQC92_18345 [Shewanella sp. 202IG2-18]|uniref:hypothetical protein n=1 Tax=Parashewanella hymeniacidonis TaxID=2807618 RepID=UPI0019618F6A|nr:hypothetical protein [Parashewanella hymeniacidonis]MBM7073971.1 hypothetical protein [Parashewanella hymeniacidonis]
MKSALGDYLSEYFVGRSDQKAMTSTLFSRSVHQILLFGMSVVHIPTGPLHLASNTFF